MLDFNWIPQGLSGKKIKKKSWNIDHVDSIESLCYFWWIFFLKKIVLLID